MRYSGKHSMKDEFLEMEASGWLLIQRTLNITATDLIRIGCCVFVFSPSPSPLITSLNTLTWDARLIETLKLLVKYLIFC
jgi:hypothetical protein